MKTGVGLINAARGGVVDEMALIKAIEKQGTFRKATENVRK